MGIILPYKNLVNNRNIKYISPKGEYITSSTTHEEYAVSYLIGGNGNLDNFMQGKPIIGEESLTLEQLEKLRNWIKERIKYETFKYMWSDFMVKELKFDRVNTSDPDYYYYSKYPTTACHVPFERFYNYYLMDEVIDFLGVGVLNHDDDNAQMGLEYMLSAKIITASQYTKNCELLEEIKTLKKTFPKKEDRIQFFK